MVLSDHASREGREFREHLTEPVDVANGRRLVLQPVDVALGSTHRGRWEPAPSRFADHVRT